jgi:predicted RNase H-like nuclease (RuvC/YqgF family)
MPDLDERVSALERDMAAMKAGVGTHEEELRTIPDRIKLEFRLGNSQMACMGRDIAKLQEDVAGLKCDVAGLEAGSDSLPRVMAELIGDMLAKLSIRPR